MFFIISLFIHLSVLFPFVLNVKECPILHKNESLPCRKEVFKRNAKPDENAFTSSPNTLKDNLYYSTLLYSIENLFRDQYKPQKRAKNHNKTGKFKKLNSSKNSKQEDETKIDKHLTKKLFQLLRKLDLGVNNDLITDLRHLKEKFNIVDISEDEFGRYGAKNEKPLNLPVDKSETNETPSLEDTTEEMTQTSELITTGQNEYSNEEDREIAANEDEYESDSNPTTVNSANEADYDETTIQNDDEGDGDYDDEVEFRQKGKTEGGKGKTKSEKGKTKNEKGKTKDKKGKGKNKMKGAKEKDGKDDKKQKVEEKGKDKKDSTEQGKVKKQKGKEESKGKPKDKNENKNEGKDKKENKDKKTEKGKQKDKEKGKTSGKDKEKEKKDGKTQTDENLSGENSSTEEVTQPSEKQIKKPSSETKPVPSNDDDDDDDDVITIRRVRGIWLGGHCRCNYFIRSSANNISTNLIFVLFSIYFLKLNKYL